MKRRQKALLAAGLLVVLGGTEVLARVAHVGDVPLYDRPPLIEYLPKPNQRGALPNGFDWYVNDRSMVSDKPFTASPNRDDVLVIGDSIVWGGAAYPHLGKLGPVLQRVSSRPVWAVGAESWSLLNELAYLDANQDLYRSVKTIVLVSNTEDFRGRSLWNNQHVQPTRPFPIRLIYPLYSRFRGPRTNIEPKATSVWQAALRKFRQSYDGQVILVAYPRKAEVLDRNLGRRRWAEITRDLRNAVPDLNIVDVALDTEWSAAAYRDDMHPTGAANIVLAKIIQRAL